MSIAPVVNSYWQYYLEHAAETEAGRADDLGAGREEQLVEVIRAATARDCVLTHAERDRLDRLPRNRSKKHIRLRRHLMSEVGKLPKNSSIQAHRFLLDDEIAWVRSRLTPAEWDVEWSLACGQTFDEVARTLLVNPDALRVRASRWRARVRREIR